MLSTHGHEIITKSSKNQHDDFFLRQLTMATTGSSHAARSDAKAARVSRMAAEVNCVKDQ